MYYRSACRGAQLSLLLGLSIFISQAEGLSLNQALARAESQNPSLEAYRERHLSASERIGAADALPDPKLQIAYFGESVQTRTGSQDAIYSFTQSVPWLTKLSTRKAVASSDADVVGFDYQNARTHLRREVAKTYAEVLYLDRAVETTMKNLLLIEDMRVIVEEQVRGGASINSMLRLEVTFERTRDDLDKLKQKRIEQRYRLAAMLVLPETKLDLTDELAVAELPLEESSQLHLKLLSENPDLQALRQQGTSAEKMADLSRLERYPDFTVGLNYIQVDGSGINSRDAGKDPWSVSLAVSLPIWEGKNQANIRAANATKRSIDYAYRNREIELKSELSSALAAYHDSRNRMQRYETKLIPLAEQALENSRSAYESNQVGVLELIDSERALLDLNLNYWRAAANTQQAIATINALIGD